MNDQTKINQLKYAKFGLSEQAINTAILEIINGNISYGRAALKYPGLSKSTLFRMVKDYQNKPQELVQMPPEKDEESPSLDQLSNRIRELEKALELANLKVSGLETMINIAEDQLKINIRKKSGSKR